MNITLHRTVCRIHETWLCHVFYSGTIVSAWIEMSRSCFTIKSDLCSLQNFQHYFIHIIHVLLWLCLRVFSSFFPFFFLMENLWFNKHIWEKSTIALSKAIFGGFFSPFTSHGPKMLLKTMSNWKKCGMSQQDFNRQHITVFATLLLYLLLFWLTQQRVSQPVSSSQQLLQYLLFCTPTVSSFFCVVPEIISP